MYSARNSDQTEPCDRSDLHRWNDGQGLTEAEAFDVFPHGWAVCLKGQVCICSSYQVQHFHLIPTIDLASMVVSFTLRAHWLYHQRVRRFKSWLSSFWMSSTACLRDGERDALCRTTFGYSKYRHLVHARRRFKCF